MKGNCFRLTFQFLKGVLIFILLHLTNIDNIFFQLKIKKEKKPQKTKIQHHGEEAILSISGKSKHCPWDL